MGPEGWRGPNLEKVGSPKGGAPKGRAQNFALFSLSRQLSFFLPSLGRSSRGILVVFEASGPGKGMSWTVVLQLLYQMQNTEPRKNVCYYSVAITASGKASHWIIALKLLKLEKEHDGDVRVTRSWTTQCPTRARRLISSRSS